MEAMNQMYEKMMISFMYAEKLTLDEALGRMVSLLEDIRDDRPDALYISDEEVQVQHIIMVNELHSVYDALLLDKISFEMKQRWEDEDSEPWKKHYNDNNPFNN